MSVTGGVTSELRQMAAEMDTFPFVPRQWHSLDATDGPDFCHGGRGMWGNAAGGHMMLTPSQAGAEVYHDIVAEGAKGTRAQIHAAIDQMILGLEPRTKAEAARKAAIYRVALGRLGVADDVVPSAPALPPGAGEYYAPVHRAEFFGCKAKGAQSSAGVLGAKLARYMRQHARKPFGPRGQAWLVQTAREVFRLAVVELGGW